MDLDNYQLACELIGHQGDVRSICYLSQVSSESHNITIASGSRDSIVKLWSTTTDLQNYYREAQSVLVHEHWISAIIDLSDCIAQVKGAPGSGFATASQDKKVRVFDKSGTLVRTLTGHTGPVTSLSVSADGCIVSGSWDMTAKVWDLSRPTGDECVMTLAGHENGACVLGLPNGDIVTGSAGVQQGNTIAGFQLRLWRDGKVVRKMTDHQGAVRCLALASIDASTFASASNDGTVRLYSFSGDLLNTMSNPDGPEGSPAFNFCVSRAGKGGQLATACDDCCVRVWDPESGALVQEIGHPCTVWWVCPLPNGDIATGGSDGAVRVFTTDASRVANDVIMEGYLQNVEASRNAIRQKQSQGVDPTKLAKIENAEPGTSEGQVKMFNNSGIAFVYQWSTDCNSWLEVGEVMGDAGGQQELDGKMYDKVVPVEVEDPASGGVNRLQLGFNSGDNPYTVATEFIKKHKLPENNLEDIVNFIKQNRGSSVPTLDMSGAGTPSQVDIDAYAFGRPASSRTSSESKSQQAFKNFPLPTAAGLTFDSVKMANVLGKFTEFNAASDNTGTLSEADMREVSAVANTLENTSRYHATSVSSSQVGALTKALAWDPKFLLPVFDLVRVGFTHPDFARAFVQLCGTEFVSRVIATVRENSGSLALVLLGTRILVNMHRHSVSRSTVTSVFCDSTGPLDTFVPLASHAKKTVRVSVATLLVNLTNAVYHGEGPGSFSSNVSSVCQSIVHALLEYADFDEETCVRACMASGVLALLGAPVDAEALDLVSSSSAATSRVLACVDEVRAAYKSKK